MVRSSHKKGEMEKSTKETAQFSLETGHDLLAKHLHKVGITDSNKCTLYVTEQHIRGHLLRCPELQDIRDALPKNMAEPEKESYLSPGNFPMLRVAAVRTLSILFLAAAAS
jgi:hypothetical protein